MLHLRVMCPAEVMDAVLDKLRNQPGAVHLTIARGVAVDPPGDLVQADVVREAVDGLLANLCELGIDHVGGITLQPLDTVLSDAADAAALAAPGEPADAVEWEELLSLTSAKSAALIGVFISVTTVPAAAFAALAVTTGAWRTAVDSTVQLLVNLVGIAFAGVLVLLLRTRREDRNLGRPLTEG